MRGELTQSARVFAHRVGRQRRTIGPGRIGQIEVGTQCNAARAEPFLHEFPHRERLHFASDRDGLAAFEPRAEPVDVLGGLRHDQPHQLHFTAGEFLSSLLEIARIGPDPGEIRRDDQRSAGA